MWTRATTTVTRAYCASSRRVTRRSWTVHHLSTLPAPSSIAPPLYPSTRTPATSNDLATPLSAADYLRLILTSRVYDVAIESPLQLAANISSRIHNAIYLKREDLQPVFSFKLRGAYNAMTAMSSERLANGVLTCSAGNHAQGVALAAERLRIKATILMPKHTPLIKVNAVRRRGAEVILFGADFDQCAAECRRLATESGRPIIHPYDDPYVIAGQGTIAVEVLRQWTRPKPPHTVFVCVGGGGLISGIAVYIKQLYPQVRIVGVEAEDADAMTQSLRAGRRVELKEVQLFADGAAVRLVGSETFRLCQEYVDDMVVVTNDEICAAIKDTFEDTRSVLEPAGALALAGCKKYIATNAISDEAFVCITSGANMNFNRLRFVSERAELGENREALLAVTIPERPGAFHHLHQLITPRNVTEFSYRYSDDRHAHIYLSFECRDRSDVEDVISRLQTNGMSAVDISHNDMAKDHTRYLAGGRSPLVTNERLFRFTFPERPGALARFLSTLTNNNTSTDNATSTHTTSSAPFNISLFHYRNYGSDTGRVLCGIQVPASDSNAFDHFLQQLGYPHVEETNNVVYKQFLL